MGQGDGMNNETLPCPFCGSTNLTSNEWSVDEDHASKFGADEFSEIWAMECMDCLGSAPLVSWNRRHNKGATHAST